MVEPTFWKKHPTKMQIKTKDIDGNLRQSDMAVIFSKKRGDRL